MNDPEFDPYLPPKARVGPANQIDFETIGLEGNPWVTIWTQPRATIRGIVNSDPTRNVHLLAAISGFSAFISNATQFKIGVVQGLLFAVVGGGLYGLLVLYVNGWLYSVSGRWVGGVATARLVRCALAWAAVPVVPLALIGLGFFFLDPNLVEFLGGLYLLASVVLGIWYFFLSVKTLAEVHQITAWAAFGAMILGGFLMTGIFILLAVVGVAIYFGLVSGGILPPPS